MLSWLPLRRPMLTSVCSHTTVLTVGRWRGEQVVWREGLSGLSRFGVGQNLYIYKQSLRRAETDWEKAVEDWYDEVTLFSSAKVPG